MIVLDANAAVEIASNPLTGPKIRELYEADEKVVSCDLMRAEVVSTLGKFTRTRGISSADANRLLEKAMSLVDEFYPMEDLQSEVLSESIRLQHSSYDVFYLVLTRRLNATLLTLDKRLSQLCLQNGVDAVGVMDLPQD